MNKIIQFLCIFLGLMLLSPVQVCRPNVSIRQERRRINKELARGKRLLNIPVQLFATIVTELREKGWQVEAGVLRTNAKLREVFVSES